MPVNSTDNVILMHGMIAIFGALVHALDANRKGHTKSPLDFLALTVMSSFTGAIFALLALYFLPDQEYLTTAIAGTGGYLGIEGMTYVLAFLQSKGIVPKNKE